MKGLLAIDAGNTRLKWGLYDGREWARFGAIDTALARESSGPLSTLGEVPCSQVVVSNVAGEEVALAIGAVFSRRSVSVRFVSSEPQQCGVVNGYAMPAQLGCDRWAALIAAHRRQAQDQLVIMAGTALTIDALSAQGVFLGGMILPGPDLMRRSLCRNTAQLVMDRGQVVHFPTNTADAMSSGVVEACVGAVMRMRAHVQEALGTLPVCVMGGGAGRALVPYFPYAVTIHDNLVLDGLLEIVRG